MEETVLSCTSEEADKLVDLLWKVTNGDVVITNVTEGNEDLLAEALSTIQTQKSLTVAW